MRTGLGLLVTVVVWIFGAAVGDRAVGAVRVCGPHVTSKVTRSEREFVAKRAAIKDWLGKAKSELVKHPSWRLANLRVIKCVRWKAGFECVAHGAPCIIKQKVPKRRKVPNKRDLQAAPEGV